MGFNSQKGGEKEWERNNLLKNSGWNFLKLSAMLKFID